MRIVIDSNIIYEDFQMDGSKFRLLFDALNKTGDLLYIPQIVIDEVKTIYAEDIGGHKNRADKLISKIERMTNKELHHIITDEFIQDAITSYDHTLSRILRHQAVEILDYPEISHQGVVERISSRKKPFGKSDKGYRDFLIWQNIISLAKQYNETIAFISKDIKAFGKKGKKDEAGDKHCLHSDLVDDLKLHDLKVDSVVLYDDLKIFLDDHIMPEMDVLKEISNLLLSGEYKGLRLQSDTVRDQISDLLIGIETSPESIGFPSKYENPTITYVDAFNDIEAIEVRKSPSGELWIEVELYANCSFDFFVFKSDYPVLSESEMESIFVWDSDWNRHYMLAGSSKRIYAVLYLMYDEESGEITSMELDHITGVIEENGFS